MNWVFFDVGGPIYNDDASVKEYYGLIRDYFGVTEERLQELRMGGIHGRVSSVHRHVIRKLAGSEQEYKNAYREIKKKRRDNELQVLREGIVETLEALKQKGYGLGILANQPPEIRERLEADGLLKFFGVVVISEEVGASKPNKRIFEIAFERAGAEPGDCWFVGDRVGNDIIPAKKMGMKTIRLRVGCDHSHDEAKSPEEKADHEVKTLAEMLTFL